MRSAHSDATAKCRLAAHADLPALHALMSAAIGELQRAYLDEDQIKASYEIMGLDTQLIDDRTYFVAEIDGQLAGCGGWSRRATLFGGDHSAGRDASLLRPGRDPAKVRAMYTHPAFIRRGVGRAILATCAAAAQAEGFTELELMATLAGEPLYLAAGFRPVERLVGQVGGAGIPLVKMRKPIESAA